MFYFKMMKNLEKKIVTEKQFFSFIGDNLVGDVDLL